MGLDEKISRHFDNFFEIVKNAEFSVNSEIISINHWFEEVIESLSLIRDRNKKLFFLGNGASASMAAHFATDFTKNAHIPSYSNTEGSFLTCFSNDYGYENAYTEMLKRLMNDGDGLILISSSGSSKNLLNVAEFSRKTFINSPIITFTSFKPDNYLKKLGNYNLYLESYEYSFAESAHAYYLHLLIDLFCNQSNTIETNQKQNCSLYGL